MALMLAATCFSAPAIAQSSAQSAAERRGRAVEILSSSGYDFDALGEERGAVRLAADLLEPTARPRAVVILSHGSGGLGGHVYRWAERLRAEGYAALVLDHFAARGVASTAAAQLGVTEQQMAADIIAAAQRLRADPTYADAPIAHIGWSKGATAGLLASVERYAAFAAARSASPGIDLFISFYPFCGFRLAGEASARLRVLAGAADDWTPSAPCAEAVAELAAAGSDASIRIFDGALHGFDYWSAGARRIDGAVTVRDRSDRCRLRVGANGETRTLDGGHSVRTRAAREAYLRECGVRGVGFGGAPELREAVERLVFDELAAISPR